MGRAPHASSKENTFLKHLKALKMGFLGEPAFVAGTCGGLRVAWPNLKTEERGTKPGPFPPNQITNTSKHTLNNNQE
jgi:hypothetical protein